MPMIQLRQFVLNKQAEIGHTIKPGELAKGTGISRDTINRLLNHRVKRVDEKTIFALCEFFGVSEGEPVPFLIYEVDN